MDIKDAEGCAMKRMVADQRLDTLLLVVLAAVGVSLVLLRNAAWGVGLHWDSINYISVARSLLAGEGFVQFTSGLYSHWPPLYPLLLAAAGFLSGLDPHAVAGPLNALLFGLTILVAGYWLRQRIASRWLTLWGCLAITFALPLTFIASWALSEPAFILFATLAMFHIDRFLREDQRTALIWAALFTALACLTRYIGLTLVLTLLPLLLLRPGVALLAKMKHGAVFALISLFPTSLWFLRNMLLFGGLFGSPLLPEHTLRNLVNTAAAELAYWILPGVSLDALRPHAVGLAVVLAIAIGFELIRTVRKPEWVAQRSSFCLCIGFVLVYLISVFLISEVRKIDIRGVTNKRHWAPLYIPLFFVLVFLLDRFLIWVQQRSWSGGTVQLPVVGTFVRGRLLAVALGIPLFIWFGITAAQNRQAIIRANEGYDRDYAAPEWVNNDVVRFVREAQVKGTIFSNSPAFGTNLASLYIHTDPANDFYYLSSLNRERTEQRIEQAVDGSYVVFWFYDSGQNPSNSYVLPELEAMPELERVAVLESGVIFRVNREQAES